MFRRQRGVTFIGWVFLLIPVAILALRGHPPGADLPELHARGPFGGADGHRDEDRRCGDPHPAAIRATLSKHFDIESISFPDVKDVAVTRDGTSWTIEAKFEDTAPLFGNISLWSSISTRSAR